MGIYGYSYYSMRCNKREEEKFKGKRNTISIKYVITKNNYSNKI